MRARVLLVVALLAAVLIAPTARAHVAPDPPAAPELQPLVDAAGGRLVASRQPSTGAHGMVRAVDGAVLWRPAASMTPEAEARAFLAAHGAVIGMSSWEMAAVTRQPDPAAPLPTGSELVLRAADRDPTTGVTHVSFDQTYLGMPVLGGRVAVHLARGGVTAVNGVFVPGIEIRRPRFDAAAAGELALQAVGDGSGVLSVQGSSVQVYRHGLIDGRPGESVLAHAVEIAADGQPLAQVWIDAADGAAIDVIPLRHEAKDRCVYTPAYVNPTGNDELAVRDEGDGPTNLPPIDGLYDYSGQVYDLFASMFGRDSWDGAGHKMRTVYDTTALCPNAYWDPSAKVTRFCPGFDIDDVVAHEWGHAYTQATHGLIYRNQPGALNESYSDIWGEVIDLTNGVDGLGGNDNENPSPVGQRWILGEDLREVGEALALRDMWDPESRSLPAKVSSPNYFCGDGDAGGVHYNSSVPNHAFAMLVDGKTYNGHTVEGIGMTKASHIYYQAMVAYQTPTSGFREHAEALRAGCTDLIGQPLNPVPGDASGQAITTDDCAQIDEAVAATEMEDPPAACGGPLLDQSPPAPCPDGDVLFSEDWESGADGWTHDGEGNSSTWPGFQFEHTDELEDRGGHAMFAANPDASCTDDANVAGRYSITSPTITAGDGATTLRFDHSVALDATDGGNVLISVNGAEFEQLPSEAYLYNPPEATVASGNPKSGQEVWSGSDTGLLTGMWGTTVADLSGLVGQGDSFVLRFELGQDCGSGLTGWYVDDISVTSCPPVDPPELSLGPDYGAPDGDGSYTLQWTRPAEATGPDVLEEAHVTDPLFSDDAESGLVQWTSTTDGKGAFEWSTGLKPGHTSTAFHARGNEAATNTSAMLTTKEAVAIPAEGQTALTFRDWAYNHAGDKTLVEVSDDGENWSSVHLSSTPYDPTGDVRFGIETLTPRTVDLTPYAGRSVFLRLRFAHGPEIYIDVTRYGWYVDDIAISTLRWQEVATVSGTSHTVSGRVAGTHLYRVSTTYGTRPSRLSNVVAATVT